MNETSGTVVFAQKDYAHGIRRLVAVAIDVFLTMMLMSIPLLVATALWVPKDVQTMNQNVAKPDYAKQRRLVYEHIGPTRYALTSALAVVLALTYNIFGRKLRGGTIGYRIARIRLVGHDGNPPPWRQLMIRTLLIVAAIFTLGLVFIPTFLRKKRQAVHDQLAATWMVRARATPIGPGQLVYKTRLFGTFPVTMTDVEPLEDSPSVAAGVGADVERDRTAVATPTDGTQLMEGDRAELDAELR